VAAFPLWLAAVQVAALPITNRFNEPQAVGSLKQAVSEHPT
jgi:threonyl-tRNA synthetase